MKSQKKTIVSISIFLLIITQLLYPSIVKAAGTVGGGTAASCTEAALDAALIGGGAVNFNCGVASHTITITGTKVISSNTQIDGGGLITISGGNSVRIFLVQSGSTLSLANITLANGNAGLSEGGAILINNGATVNIADSTISNNTSSVSGAVVTSGGGAIRNDGLLIVTRSTFTGNSATGFGADGGALISAGALNISNTTFYNNSAANGFSTTGGAIRINGGTGPNIITHVTFSGNTVADPAYGGALDIANADISLNASIISNSGVNLDCTKRLGGILTSTNNLIENGASCLPATTLDPGLSPLQNNGGSTQTMAITTTSPAYNYYTVPCLSAIDQRGISRPQPAGGNCDIGAYELDSTAPTVTITSTATNPTNTSPIPVTIAFSESVTGFTLGEITVGNGTAGNFDGSGTTYTADITPSANGVVTVNVGAGVAQDSGGNNNTVATQFSITFDTTAPTVTITSGPANPINSTFASFVFTTAGNPTSIECDLDGGGFVACDTTTTQAYAGPLSATSHTFTVRVTDAANNSSIDTYAWTIDTTALTMTVEQAATQADPTNASPILFTVVFSKPINPTTFDNTDITLGGTAPGTLTAVVTEVAPNDGTLFNIAVSGMTGNGTVTASIGANTVQDPAGNNNTASTSTDNTVTYDTANPSVVSTDLNVSYTGIGPTNFTVTFNKAVDDPAGNTGTDDATNPANYRLINKGANGTVDTPSCNSVVIADDTLVPVTSVSYNNATFTSTVTLASPLPAGMYRLFICGTTSIVDLASNPLNGGTDYTFDFVVQAAQQTSPRTDITSLPATGFPMNQVTSLPAQPEKLVYASTDLWLEIPRLRIKMSIVGVPSTSQGWDVSWLDKNAGWLEGSAFPTWNGNSVITAHVWDALNRPGPFVSLKTLKYGDQIKIHAFGQIYVYEVRESTTISPNNVSAMLKHEEKTWITLITCEDYKEQSQTYSSRRMVRAVLVKVTGEK